MRIHEVSYGPGLQQPIATFIYLVFYSAQVNLSKYPLCSIFSLEDENVLARRVRRKAYEKRYGQ